MSEERDREILGECFAANEHVQIAFYFKWKFRGCPQGDSLTDWVDAHKELMQASH